MIANTIVQLDSAGIEIPDRVRNSLAVIEAAKTYRGVRRDAASELAAAFHAGTLTPDNFGEKLRDALIAQLSSQAGPSGVLAWQASQAVENVAELSVRAWLATQWDDLLDHFGEQFDAEADKLAEVLPRALPPGSDPDTILKYGRKGIEAANLVGELEGRLNYFAGILRTVAAEIDEALPLGRFVDPGDDDLPPESGVWASYIRAGHKVGLVTPERAAAVEARAAERAHLAEVEEWRPRIRAEVERMIESRDRGMRPNFVLAVPPEYEFLINEIGADMGIFSNQFARA
jgi:hypothetical protein